jgi:hypothetical protein
VREVVGLNQDQLGLGGTVVREADHLITGGEAADPGADLLDDPGEVAALPGRERRREQLRHRPRTDDRLVDSQHVDPAELVVPDCLHHDLFP